GSCHVLCRRQSATPTSGLPQVQGLGDGFEPRAATTFEKTFASWLPMVRRTTRVRIETRTRTARKPSTVTTTAVVAPPPARRGGGASCLFGSHACPFHRHILSGETAAFHCAPSHHQKPSGDNMVC